MSLEPGTPIVPPSDFPVQWPDPAASRLHWTRDVSHNPGPTPPLRNPWPRHGIAYGYRYWDGPYDGIRECRINTFEYSAAVPLDASPDEFRQRAERARQRLEAMGRDLERQWSERWFPELEERLGVLAGFQPQGLDDGQLVDVFHTADQHGRRLWEIHFELVFLCGYVRRQLDELCQDLFGPDSPYTAVSLTSGEETWSVANGRALQDLADLARSHPAVWEAIQQGSWRDVRPRLAAAPGGPAFLTAFETFIAVHGRKLAGELMDPTWFDDPTIPLDNLRQLLRLGGEWGRERRADVLAERRRLTAAAFDRLANYPGPVVDEFRSWLESARVASRLMEDHNFYIDQQTAFYFRRLARAFADRLTAAGTLNRPEDVAFLEAGELVPALTGELSEVRALVAGRQEEMRRWAKYPAPMELGTVAGPPPEHPLFGRRGGAPEPPPNLSDPNRLTGQPGSRGQARGRARVIASLSEASQLEPGDILVTVTTSPSWATWYPLLGGLVTESGSALSHAAVVAREYGIPAVVSVSGATTRIRTGMGIDLDGTAGTVRILDEAASR